MESPDSAFKKYGDVTKICIGYKRTLTFREQLQQSTLLSRKLHQSYLKLSSALSVGGPTPSPSTRTIKTIQAAYFVAVVNKNDSPESIIDAIIGSVNLVAHEK